MTEAHDVAALARRLVAALGPGGTGLVDASTRRRAEYTSDASNYRVVPQVVVFPRDAADVQAVTAVCRDEGVPLTSRGAGTSVAGNAIGTGVVLDFSVRMNRVLHIDPVARTAVVQPGVVLDDLQRAAAVHGLRFGPDPSTHARCTLGGMIGNDACGSHALAYGRTSDNVLALTVVDGHGRLFDTGSPPEDLSQALRAVAADNLATLRTELNRFGRQVSGYALHHLLPEHNTGSARLDGERLARLVVGSEGTLATIVEATVCLVASPAATSFVVLGFADMISAADATPALLDHNPLAMEGIDRRLVDAVGARGSSTAGLPAGNGWLFVELGGETEEQSRDRARALVAAALAAGATDAVIVDSPTAARSLWRIREDGAGLAGRTPAGRPAWPGWEDAAVPPANLGAYLRDFDALMDRHGLDGLAYGHFGDGCIHVRIDLPLSEPQGSVRTRTFLHDAARLVSRHGGSLSGEHGDGRARSELLSEMYSPQALDAFAQAKAVFDPDDLLNPGVIVRPRPLVEDLRVPAARPAGEYGGRTRLAFAYPNDGDDFTTAVHRCVGIGKCRTDSGGVMCPSYLATADEKDSTRARARLLQEMANGDLVTDGWRSTEVLDSLDLCPSCKGCSVDCPAGVDMATYKAEFLDHHYRGRLRPRSHYSLGWLPRWSRAAALSPRAANAALGLPGVTPVLRWLGGVDPRRPLPRFAEQGFRAWFADRGPATAGPAPEDGGTPVILWVDTFTDHFAPEVGRAAVEVLEHLGFDVRITRDRVCCGLTWVSTGQLAGARRQLVASLEAIEDVAATAWPGVAPATIPVVGLEPSCTAQLRDEAARLVPGDARAEGLEHRVVGLAELVARHRPDWRPPVLGESPQPAVVQPHCHQHASTGFAADTELLRALGLEATVLDGCCGLAGNFGAERGHYDVSVSIAERALLPAVRSALDQSPQATVIADGYSCRTQTQNLTAHVPLHLAQVLASAIRSAPSVRTPTPSAR